MEKIKFIWVTLSQAKNHTPKGTTPKTVDYLLSVSAISFVRRLSQDDDIYEVILAEEQLPNVGFAVEMATTKLSQDAIMILNKPH
jgi:hypothetical protein